MIFDMIRIDIKEIAGDYLSELMKAELTYFLGREPYERLEGKANHLADSGVFMSVILQ